MVSAAQMALENAGIVKESKMKLIINGADTIAPIVNYLIRTKQDDSDEALRATLDSIKTISAELVKIATDNHYRITDIHLAAMNRLAIRLFCDNANDLEDLPITKLASFCSELFQQDEIYAEKMVQELTNEKEAVQFSAIARIAASITQGILPLTEIDNTKEHIENILIEIVEVVDQHIDTIYDDFIDPMIDLPVRKHLLESASAIIESILKIEKDKKKVNSQYKFQSAVVMKKFEIAYRNYIEAITLALSDGS